MRTNKYFIKYIFQKNYIKKKMIVKIKKEKEVKN